jgi:predicted Zn-dependent peptidase
MFARMIVPILLLVIGLTGPARADYTLVHEPNPDDPMAVRIFELDNGLTVYLSENHETPRFYAEIAVRAGSVQDPAETTGLAHYLEHLLFKGTQNIGTLDFAAEKNHLDRITELYEEHFREEDPAKRHEIYAQINTESQQAAQYAIPNEFDRLYRSMGARGLNAHTWHEETVYRVNLPGNRLEQWAAIESERFSNPVFRLFQPELEIVYEEKNRAMDNKDRIISEAVSTSLYKVHPYGQQTTLGSVEHLKKPSLKNIYKYFNTYYVPNNMAIMISGDIDTEQTIETIDRYFSSWERKPLPEAKNWSEEPLQGVETVTTQYEGEEYVLLAFRTTPINDADADALKLFDMVLSNRVAGLIDLNLNQQQRVRSAGSYPSMYNEYGAQYLWGIPKDGQSLEDVQQLLLEQVALVKAGQFDDWIIRAIITDFKKNYKGDLESDEARVATMRQSYIAYQDWDYTVDEIARMEKLGKEDIVRVANAYFGDAYVAGYRKDDQHEVPEIEKPKIDAIAIDPTRESEFAKKILAMPVNPIEPEFVDPKHDYTIAEDPKGTRLYYVENPINDLFTLTFAVEIGTLENNRLGPAAQLLDKSGAGEFSAEDLKKEWYKLGTDFGVGSGDHETSISISGLDENFEASVELLMTVLQDPKADQSTLDELIQIILINREDAKKDANSINTALVQYNRYGAKSAYLRMLPTEDVKALTIEELHSITKRLLTYKHSIMYTGSLPIRRVKKVLKKHHPVKKELLDPPPYERLTPRSVEQSEIYFFDKEMAQAQIRIEYGGEVYTEDHVPASQLFNSYFAGGMGGLVFQELRESRALAYAAGASYALADRAGDTNLMIGGMGTQADKAPEALDGFIGLMDTMPVSDERFVTAKDALIENYRTGKLGFRGIIGAVRSWERLGVPVDPREARFARVQSADLEAMLGFYESEIKGRPKLISIVGDKSKIDMDAVEAKGKVVDLGLDAIFVE